MRISVIIVITLLLTQLLTDTYIFIVALRRTRSERWPRIQLCSAAIMLIYLIVTLALPRRGGNDSTLLAIMWMMFGYFTIYLSKLLFVIIDLLATLPVLIHKHRIRCLSWIGAASAVALFIGMWWGALINRLNIDIQEVNVHIQDLPNSFNGFRIVQISDLHVGTYGNDTTYISHVVDAVNNLNPDVICFTGDIVNRRSDELLPFVHTLSRLKARYGIFSILGNHDYGDYSSWPSAAAKQTNMELLYKQQNQMGWRLLLNETEWIHIGNDSIAIIGVENVGDPPFPCYGDLSTAYPTLNDSTTKILLSHNPFHWNTDICNHSDINIALTLAGHTHAMQMEMAGISPAALRYSTWSGLYADNNDAHKLYVNIGIGTVGIPMRLGATPEITTITLTSK